MALKQSKMKNEIKENYFDCEVTFVHDELSRSTLEQLKDKFKDIKEYEKCHTNFDCKDKNGEIADVCLFHKNNKLFARGKKNTKYYRNPENVYSFLNRDRRVKKIVLVYREKPYTRLNFF